TPGSGVPAQPGGYHQAFEVTALAGEDADRGGRRRLRLSRRALCAEADTTNGDGGCCYAFPTAKAMNHVRQKIREAIGRDVRPPLTQVKRVAEIGRAHV